MRSRYLFIVPIVAGLAVLTPLRISAGETPSKERINELIEQLGSDSFAEREKASKTLAAIGVPALEALRQAAKSEDAEVRKRAEELLPKIELQAESMRVLAPQRVHLIYKDKTLGEAVADFQKKSGYSIQLHDRDGKLKERKITLDTGETTFWHAFALFCDKADLSEAGVEDLLRTAPLPGAPVAQVVVAQSGRGLLPGTKKHLALKDGKAKRLPTDDRSAARIRVLAKADSLGNAPEGEVILPLEVSLEPKLQWQVIQSVHVEKVLDDREQELVQLVPQVEGAAGLAGGNPGILVPGVGGANPQQQQLRFIRIQQMQMERLRRQGVWWATGQIVPVHLKKGDKNAHTLKKLKGTITAQLLTEPRAVITADKLEQAAGKVFKGEEGGSIKIESVHVEEKQTTIQLVFEQPPFDKVVPVPPNLVQAAGIRGGVQFQDVKLPVGDGFMDSFNGLSVQDDKGNSLPIDVRQARMQMSFVPQGNEAPRLILTCTLVCPHDKDKGQPAKAVYLSRKRALVEIPFTLEDVPLPCLDDASPKAN